MKKEKQNSDKDPGFWAEGAFMQPMSKEDMDSKMGTFHKKHDEDMNFNCKKCNMKISAHNRDWHDGMCDECFDRTYFPDVKAGKNNSLLEYGSDKREQIPAVVRNEKER